MTVSKFQRPRPITNHILPLFKIKAQFYPFQSLSEPPLAFQICCSKMLICPHRENTNWFLKVWSIIFLVPSKPHLSSNQWRLLSISPGAHLTINPLVVDGDKLYVCSSSGTTWCITCASPDLACWGFHVRHLCVLAPLPKERLSQDLQFEKFLQKNQGEGVSTDVFRAKVYSWSSREIGPLSWSIILHDDFSGQNWVHLTAVKCGI